MRIDIRAALPGERAELEDLQRRASLAIERYRADLEQHPEAIQLPLAQILERRVHVAVMAGRIVGFSAVLPKADHQFDLDGLFVEPAQWRNGIGRELICDALECARTHGVTAIDVLANPSAEIFYEKQGFREIGWAETQFGPARIMRRLL